MTLPKFASRNRLKISSGKSECREIAGKARYFLLKKRVKQSEFDYFERIKSVLVKSKKPFKITGRSGVFSALSVDNGAGRPKLSIMKFEKIDPKSLNENSAKLIGADWLLICAGTPEKYNMMTASWGAFGFMWNAPSIFVFVRPTRYTYRFMEESKGFTIKRPSGVAQGGFARLRERLWKGLRQNSAFRAHSRACRKRRSIF